MIGPGLGEMLARLVDREPARAGPEVLESLSPYRKFEAMERLK